MAHLKGLRKLTEEELQTFIVGKKMPVSASETTSELEAGSDTKRWI